MINISVHVITKHELLCSEQLVNLGFSFEYIDEHQYSLFINHHSSVKNKDQITIIALLKLWMIKCASVFNSSTSVYLDAVVIYRNKAGRMFKN